MLESETRFQIVTALSIIVIFITVIAATVINVAWLYLLGTAIVLLVVALVALAYIVKEASR